MSTPDHVKIAPTARRQVQALPQKRQKSVVKLLEALSINPRPPGATKIEGMFGLYAETISHIRLIYKVEEQEVLLLLVKPALAHK